MIIDIIGVRGVGKSTAYKLLAEKHGALGREDRKKFDIPSWDEFTRGGLSPFSNEFLSECRRFRDFRTGGSLPRKTLKNYQAEFCLRMALEHQLKRKEIFAWDKGLLEVLTHTVLHSREDIDKLTRRIMDGPIALHWPDPRRYLWLKSKKAFKRASVRARNYQWDKETFDRMAHRHEVFVSEFLRGRPGVHKILNDGTIETLEKAIAAARAEEK